METREKEIVALALEEVTEAVFLARSPTPEIARALGSVGERLRERVLALRTPPSPQSGGAVELYRCGEFWFERDTKAEAVIEAARKWVKSPFLDEARELSSALSALDKE
jgi:hypothetical protein